VSHFDPAEKSLWLQRVCEDNYRKLERLVPDLQALADGQMATGLSGLPPLHVSILERSPYTLLLELTHHFSFEAGSLVEPAVRIRVCFDARTAEVLSDHVRADVMLIPYDQREPSLVLDYKWRLNYFLSRWLEHCLDYQYDTIDQGSSADAVVA
jgi:uncharacterized protein YqiB (DUF1249 family)